MSIAKYARASNQSTALSYSGATCVPGRGGGSVWVTLHVTRQDDGWLATQCRRGQSWLGDGLMNDLAADISQAELAPLVLEGEPAMVDAHQMQNRGVEVADV